MFDQVAGKYDRTNTVLTFGQDRRWRRAMVTTLGLAPGMVVADVAAGTAVSTVELAQTGATAIAVDFSLGMLRAGAQRRAVPMVAADALALPFPDASVDAVTISFGLRNVVDTAQALREFARICKPGGQLLVCEFSRPRAWLRWAYLIHLRTVLPFLARRFSSNPEAYSYLGESIKAWPDQPALARLIGECGWVEPTWRDRLFGIVALHHAVRA